MGSRDLSEMEGEGTNLMRKRELRGLVLDLADLAILVMMMLMTRGRGRRPA
jgi:hypothetical protein